MKSNQHRSLDFLVVLAGTLGVGCVTLPQNNQATGNTGGFIGQPGAGGQTAVSSQTGGAMNATGGTLASSGGAGTSGGTASTGTCETGAETCACYPNDTCNAGLTCASHICVNLGTGGSTGAGGMTAAGGTINSGGEAQTGGAADSGGVEQTGGAANTGGAAQTGGAANTGGTRTSGCAKAVVPTATGNLKISSGYLTAGSLHGYAYTWQTADSIVPETCITPTCDSTGCSPAIATSAICAAGTVAADTSWNSVVGLGFNFNQSSDGSTPLPVSAPAAITVSYSNPGGSPLQVLVANNESTANTSWCVDSGKFASGQPIPITSFNTKCWDNSGTYLSAGTPITSIDLVVPSDAEVARPFAACLTDVTFSGDQGTDDAGVVDGGSNDCPRGPGGYCYYTWTQSPTSTAEWVVEPNATEVKMYAQSADDGVAGMSAVIADSGSLDLSSYDELWFDASVPMGTPFVVNIGNSTGGWCTWDLIGRGTARYTVDLTSASSCGPTACGLSRAAVTSIGFQTYKWGTNYTLDIALTNLGFSQIASSVAPSTTAAGSGIGLNGWCWSLYFWSTTGAGASSSWVNPPSADECHFAVTDTSSSAGAGAQLELPSNSYDLSGTSYVVMDALVALTDATSIVVQLSDGHGAFCGYPVTAVTGPYEYRIALGSPNYCGMGSGYDFNMNDVRIIEVMSDGQQTGNTDFTITTLRFE